MASLTQWTWVWASSRSWWWTGRPGVLWSMGSQRVRLDWATEQHRQRNWTRVTQKEGLTQITKFHGCLALATSAFWFLLSISQLHLPGRDALHITYFKKNPLSQRKENLVSFTNCLSVQFDLWSLNNTRLRATSLNTVANPCIIVMGTLYPWFHICSFGQPQVESHPWTCCNSDPCCSGNSCLRDMMALFAR